MISTITITQTDIAQKIWELPYCKAFAIKARSTNSNPIFLSKDKSPSDVNSVELIAWESFEVSYDSSESSGNWTVKWSTWDKITIITL